MLVSVLVTRHVLLLGGAGGVGGGGGAGGVGGAGGGGVGFRLLRLCSTSGVVCPPLAGSLTMVKVSAVTRLGRAAHV